MEEDASCCPDWNCLTAVRTHTLETFTGCGRIKSNAQRFFQIRSVRPHVLCWYVFAYNIFRVWSGLEGDEGNEQLEKVMTVISDTYPGCHTCCISPFLNAAWSVYCNFPGQYNKLGGLTHEQANKWPSEWITLGRGSLLVWFLKSLGYQTLWHCVSAVGIFLELIKWRRRSAKCEICSDVVCAGREAM